MSQDHTRNRGSTATAIVAGVVVVTLGAAGLWWFSDGDPDVAVDPDRTIVVERREVLDAVNASGRVEPLARVAVMSRAGGILEHAQPSALQSKSYAIPSVWFT